MDVEVATSLARSRYTVNPGRPRRLRTLHVALTMDSLLCVSHYGPTFRLLLKIALRLAPANKYEAPRRFRCTGFEAAREHVGRNGFSCRVYRKQPRGSGSCSIAGRPPIPAASDERAECTEAVVFLACDANASARSHPLRRCDRLFP